VSYLVQKSFFVCFTSLICLYYNFLKSNKPPSHFHEEPLWARVSLALAAVGDENAWRQPLLMVKTKAESDDMNFWLFSKDVLRPLLNKHKIVFSTQELEALMKSSSNKPGHVSLRKFEQVIFTPYIVIAICSFRTSNLSPTSKVLYDIFFFNNIYIRPSISYWYPQRTFAISTSLPQMTMAPVLL
jgi:hypothetical protein